jgi:hypothetical protein
VIASQPTIDSAILRLAKERNEARELVKRMAYAPADDTSQERHEAHCAALRAVRMWKEGGHE